jgi:hypothetical protein
MAQASTTGSWLHFCCHAPLTRLTRQHRQRIHNLLHLLLPSSRLLRCQLLLADPLGSHYMLGSSSPGLCQHCRSGRGGSGGCSCGLVCSGSLHMAQGGCRASGYFLATRAAGADAWPVLHCM